MGRRRPYQLEKCPKGRHGICTPLNKAQDGMPQREAEQIHVRMDPKREAGLRRQTKEFGAPAFSYSFSLSLRMNSLFIYYKSPLKNSVSQ